MLPVVTSRLACFLGESNRLGVRCQNPHDALHLPTTSSAALHQHVVSVHTSILASVVNHGLLQVLIYALIFLPGQTNE